MITLEIIVFIAAILFGIVIYVRESKRNKLYRFFNKLMHAKELQMSPDNPKGFVYQQPFLMRLVWVSLLFLLAAIIVAFVTPFDGFYIQYFASAIVGTLIGTYIASFFFATSKGLQKENLKKTIEKGKEFIEELTEGDQEIIEVEATDVPEKLEAESKPEEAPKKSARDRLKDKGMIN
jgi:glucan phosphoethanolaminetransferase (alkaline phosphatase superfamily)